MWTNPFQKRNNADRKRSGAGGVNAIAITAEADKTWIQEKIRAMHTPLFPGDTVRAKVWDQRVAGWSNCPKLTPGRVKKYRLGYVAKPTSHERRAIARAFLNFIAALEEKSSAFHQRIEAERADLFTMPVDRAEIPGSRIGVAWDDGGAPRSVGSLASGKHRR